MNKLSNTEIELKKLLLIKHKKGGGGGGGLVCGRVFFGRDLYMFN